MRNVYAAEEAGVWQTNVEVPSEISEQSDLSAGVSQISNEAPELELSDEDKVEVSMLNESKSVIEATEESLANQLLMTKKLSRQSALLEKQAQWINF